MTYNFQTHIDSGSARRTQVHHEPSFDRPALASTTPVCKRQGGALSYTSRQHRNVGKAETTLVAVWNLKVGDVVAGRGRVLAITGFGYPGRRFVSFADGNDEANLSDRYEVISG